jgi:hypothetical protein
MKIIHYRLLTKKNQTLKNQFTKNSEKLTFIYYYYLLILFTLFIIFSEKIKINSNFNTTFKLKNPPFFFFLPPNLNNPKSKGPEQKAFFFDNLICLLIYPTAPKYHFSSTKFIFPPEINSTLPKSQNTPSENYLSHSFLANSLSLLLYLTHDSIFFPTPALNEHLLKYFRFLNFIILLPNSNTVKNKINCLVLNLSDEKLDCLLFIC